MQVESWRAARVRTSKFGVAPVTNGHFFEAPIYDEVDERCAAQDAVGDEIAAEPVEAGADAGAHDDDRQSHLRIEIFARVEIFAATHRTSIDRAIVADRFADRQRNAASAPAALNGARGVGGSDGETGITLRTFDEDLQVFILSALSSIPACGNRPAQAGHYDDDGARRVRSIRL